MPDIQRLAKLAAARAYPLLKQANYGLQDMLFEFGKSQTAPGKFQKQLEELNLPRNQTFMSMLSQVGSPLLETVGGVGGLPAMMGLLDMMRGGGNIGMLLRGKDNSSPLAMLRSSTAADPNAVFNPKPGDLQKAMTPIVNTAPQPQQSAPGVVTPPPPPQQTPPAQPAPQPNVPAPAPGPITTMNQTPPSGYVHHGGGRYTSPTGNTGIIDPNPGGLGPTPLGRQILAQPAVPKPQTAKAAPGPITTMNQTPPAGIKQPGESWTSNMASAFLPKPGTQTYYANEDTGYKTMPTPGSPADTKLKQSYGTGSNGPKP